MRNPSTSREIAVNFYLPCALSGLLLAGLIAITNPAPGPDFAVDTSILAAQSQ